MYDFNLTPPPQGIDLVIDIVFLICLVVIGIWAPRELVDKWNEMFPQYKMTVEGMLPNIRHIIDMIISHDGHDFVYD